ncbi:MAG: AAA family ATPase [Desulfobacter sp.]|nr:MAG: AAA family ATPase [Desulfobacter sp.]
MGNKSKTSTGCKAHEIDDFQPKTISADFDPALLPERPWIVLGSILLGHVSIIIGPGGVCKSIYSILVAIMVAARGLSSQTDLIGPVMMRGKTLIINNEDDHVEMERRIAGVMIAYGIKPPELENQFYYESGYGARRLICDSKEDGQVVKAPFVDRLVDYIEMYKIKVLVVDPFVSSHRSSENDNSKIDDVVHIYKSIAAVTCCAIVLVHHTRKGSANGTPTIEDSRGGKALSDGCRVGEIILPLSKQDQKRFGLSDNEARNIVRMDNVKANYSQKGEGVYLRLDSITLPNGDSVGVPRRIELKEKDNSHGKGKGKRIAEIAQFMAKALTGKIGPDGGSLPWAKLRAKYMPLANVRKSTANNEVIRLSKSREKAQKTSFIDAQGQHVFYQVWYSKGDKKTSPITVHVEPQTENPGQEKEPGNDTFTGA